GDFPACPRKSPGDGGADETTADDGDVEFANRCRHGLSGIETLVNEYCTHCRNRLAGAATRVRVKSIRPMQRVCVLRDPRIALNWSGALACALLSERVEPVRTEARSARRSKCERRCQHFLSTPGDPLDRD